MYLKNQQANNFNQSSTLLSKHVFKIFSMKLRYGFFALLLFSFSLHAFSQTNEAQYQKALQLKSEKKFEEALPLFEQLVKNDSNEVNYLTNTAFLLCIVGNRQKAEADRQKYFHTAEYLSKKAIRIDNNSGQAHYNYAFALGRINEFAGSKQKIANAKEIKTECDNAIRLDPTIAGAYHVLGRWHRTIAGFNFIERAMINTMFGGVPQGGSLDAAVDCFAKAVKLEPGNKLHYYELALTYHERGKGNDDIYAKVWLKKALELPSRDVDDKETQKKCEALLKKVE